MKMKKKKKKKMKKKKKKKKKKKMKMKKKKDMLENKLYLLVLLFCSFDFTCEFSIPDTS
ncbi:hypothetical protein [Methanosarcina sp. Kolksee]|uniref:hypothetical protein n=1 Tax=Methanosarcina sp. Kolksee TaxID=1434099 RepID=UPI0012E094DE|nr:hypothetical protein [Methanosarcina sp. Kolksee]